MNIQEEELNTDEVSFNLNSKQKCLCIVFRAIISIRGRIQEYSKHLKIMQFYPGLCADMVILWFFSFNYQRIFKEPITNSTFKGKRLRYIVTWLPCFFMKSCKGPLLCTFYLQSHYSLFTANRKLQESIESPVKHLRWSIFGKQLMAKDL